MNLEIPETPRRIVVVGGGHGGGAVVGFLRQYGFAGTITLIGEEPVAPYHRPPLSKAWLKGDVTVDGLALKPGPFYSEQNVELRLCVRVESIDPAARCVALATGERLPYDELILATGAYPRTLPLPGAGHHNVMTLRNLADAEKLRGALGPGKRLAIIGGGYVGLECAATARALGAEVVVIEKAPRLLERVASVPISAFLQRYHERHGVGFALAANIEAIEGTDRAEAVRLADGRRFPCDALLIGVGAAPAIALAAAAGIACNDGITVDDDCRTSVPHVFALGDVAKRPHPLYQRALRLESVPSSMEQAKRVAAVITGREPAHAEVPWFWSDQYDLKLQIAGLPFDADELVVRGDPEADKFAVFHLRDGRVVTVEAISAPPEFFAGKKLIASGKVLTAAQLADLAVPLTELIA
ncbi:MAG: FAD-dependent oxidoreductase [Rhodocyclaceae bacterium]|nr:FAD-dependent oxidoreductase [Rhodocyclaceae bacterium]